jgi:hypothetical protein
MRARVCLRAYQANAARTRGRTTAAVAKKMRKEMVEV